jgi:hypothetical protein
LEIIKAKMNGLANASSGGNEDATGESYTPEGVGLCELHPGIDPRSIMNISKGSFNAWNPYKLRFGAIQVEKDEAILSFGENGLLSKAATGSAKDYGTSPLIWIGCFTTYISILLAIHGEVHPQLSHALLLYFGKIQHLSGIYPWQNSVLRLAIQTHSFAIAKGVTNPDAWVLTPSAIDSYCRYTAPPAVVPQKRGNSGNDDGEQRFKKKPGRICGNIIVWQVV